MICFTVGDRQFNYRIAGILLDGDHVLLHRGEEDDFWTLPGGRAESGEPATETLQREMREELGVKVVPERLVWIVENFFTWNGTAHHELGLYFLMSLSPGSSLPPDRAPFIGGDRCPLTGQSVSLFFQWFPIAELEQLVVHPAFLRTSLQSLPTSIEHVVVREE